MQHFSQIAPRVCTLVLLIFTWFRSVFYKTYSLYIHCSFSQTRASLPFYTRPYSHPSSSLLPYGPSAGHGLDAAGAQCARPLHRRRAPLPPRAYQEAGAAGALVDGPDQICFATGSRHCVHVEGWIARLYSTATAAVEYLIYRISLNVSFVPNHCNLLRRRAQMA